MIELNERLVNIFRLSTQPSPIIQNFSNMIDFPSMTFPSMKEFCISVTILVLVLLCPLLPLQIFYFHRVRSLWHFCNFILVVYLGFSPYTTCDLADFKLETPFNFSTPLLFIRKIHQHRIMIRTSQLHITIFLTSLLVGYCLVKPFICKICISSFITPCKFRSLKAQIR
jgi:hypothetical protein